MARETGRYLGNTISPEAASSSSSLKNVLGYFQDYIPQSYASSMSSGGSNVQKEVVHWARFETEEYFMREDSSAQPLVLLTGLSSGVVLWMITPNGEAKEVYSTLHDGEGSVKTATLLKSPPPSKDNFRSSRPLLAIVKKGSGVQKHLHCSAVVISLRGGGGEGGGGGKEVKKFEFEKNSILDINSNKCVVVITLQKRLVILDTGTFEKKWTVKTGYRSSELWTNPIALGERWLAFSDLKIHPHLLSIGGVSDRLTPPVASTVVSTVKKGFSALSDTLSGLTGRTAQATRTALPAGEESPPVVTILDIEHSHTGEVQVSELRKNDGVMAHFLSHTINGAHITMFKFNRSGNILFSADSEGQYFNIFHISPNLLGSTECKVNHLYTLYRGTTTGIVQDVSFSNDSRWCAISTRNGTTHLFPISPYGGAVTVRTHKLSHVVNQYSRFHMSAGIEETATGGNTGRHSPLMMSSLQQIKQQYLPGSMSGEEGSDRICVRAHFALTSFENSTNSLKMIDFTERKAEYSLYILGGDGSLTEYTLQPDEGTSQGTGGGGVNENCEEALIELQSAPKITWRLLSKPFDAPPTLTDHNYLISSHKVYQEKMESLGCGSIFLPDKESWLSQVELLSYAPPTRRIWMGPQFSFKRVSHTPTQEEEEEEGVGSPLAVLPPSHDYLSSGGSLGGYSMIGGGEGEAVPTSISTDSCSKRRRKKGKEDETSGSACSSFEDTDVEAFGSWKDVAPRLKGGGPDLELLIQEAMADKLTINDDKRSKCKTDHLPMLSESTSSVEDDTKSVLSQKRFQESY